MRRGRWVAPAGRALTGSAAAVALGVATAAVGAALTLKPFSSLDALTLFVGAGLVLAGAGDLVAARRDGGTPAAHLPGVLLALGGVLAVAWPAITVEGLALLAGVGLLVSGAARVAMGVRGATSERARHVLGGVASVVAGVLALAWPDLSILAMALLVGPVAVVLGLAQVVHAVRPARHGDGGARRGRVRRGLRVARAGTGLALALALAALSAFLHGGSGPDIDAFYATPASLPEAAGALLRHDTWDGDVPPGADARRILYTTTGADGRAQATSGLVVVPRGARGSGS